ncbi:alpha/beta fold hydrolase [Cryomorphaceae bacterium]|nr:alpha/beta fold hydrolase [Cryomorphaceae bacterium]
MRIVGILALLLSSFFVSGQVLHWKTEPEGHYRGAYQWEHSLQFIDAEIYREGDALMIRSRIPEWTDYGFLESEMQRDSVGLYTFNTYWGKTTARFDSVYREWIGHVDYDLSRLDFHMKAVVRPGKNNPVEKTDWTINRGEVQLNGELWVPASTEPLPLAILIHGRGCGDRSGFIGKAEALSKQGIAVFMYDKRGTGQSTGDCALAVHDELVADAVAVFDTLTSQEAFTPGRSGFIGYSAGGWISPAASAKCNPKPGFLITVVGPATSVKGQQLDGARAFGKVYGYSQADSLAIERYTNLTFETRNPSKTYKEMRRLLDEGQGKSWLNWLEDTDIPSSPEAISELWVQRFSYDPGPDLQSLQIPVLSLLGGSDPVVPWETNSARFMEVMANNPYARCVIMPKASHGMEHGDRQVELDIDLWFKPSYYKFDRVAPGVYEEIIDFIHKKTATGVQ